MLDGERRALAETEDPLRSRLDRARRAVRRFR
jgi:hypothetical protein